MKKGAVEIRKLLRELIKELGLLQKEKYACCGLTLAQCHCLVETGDLEKTTVNRLAESLKLDQSTVSRMVDGLVKEGYLERELAEEDRRKVEISLSAKGESSYKQVETMMGDYFEEITGRIPAGKREQVIESLELLLNAIKEKGTSCCGGIIPSQEPEKGNQ